MNNPPSRSSLDRGRSNTQSINGFLFVLSNFTSLTFSHAIPKKETKTKPPAPHRFSPLPPPQHPFLTPLLDSREQHQLVRRLHRNMAPHDAVDQRRVPLVRAAPQQCHRRGLRAQSKRSHGVHDEVNPQHHHGVQRRLVPAHGAQER